MKYTDFSKSLKTISAKELGGLKAHSKLVPGFRQQQIKNYKVNTHTRRAAVLALFYPDSLGDTRFLLTLRASYKGTHSAQVSFPGGKTEPQDKSLAATALREANEEVGVETSAIRLIRELTDVYIPPSNFLVTPFIGVLDKAPVFKANHEVDKLVEVLYTDLLDDTLIQFKNLEQIAGIQSEIPYFNFNGEVVWGATAMIISEIRELFKTL